MILLLFCLCCVLEPLFLFMSVVGKREPLQRYIIEEDTQNAIFGSYSYNPIKDVFEPPVSENETQSEVLSKQFINSSYVLSTAVGGDATLSPDNETSSAANKFFRHHLTSTKSTMWWMRAATPNKNATVKIRMF